MKDINIKFDDNGCFPIPVEYGGKFTHLAIGDYGVNLINADQNQECPEISFTDIIDSSVMYFGSRFRVKLRFIMAILKA